MTKLWGGRFSDEPDLDFEAFNASFPFDYRLLEYDVRCAKAHLSALRELSVVSVSEGEQIHAALEDILETVRADPGYLDRAIAAGLEDVHSFVEAEVVRRVGEVGYKLNTGRSRNDQVATDLRLYVRDAVDRLQKAVWELLDVLVHVAEDHVDVAVPGYTHLQRAQPVLFAHYLLAYVEMLRRDAERLSDARRRVNVSPLGAAALAGSGYPLNRRREARSLGFDEISRNSMDSVSDRDFIIEFQAAAALIMVHLSRLSEDLIVFSSSEFGFVEFSDRVTSGSSLMPQKKNPDALELIRGKAARVIGNHTALLILLKGLPLTYNKDLQEDKEPLFDTTTTVLDCLRLARTVLLHMRVNRERLSLAVREQYLNATELADYLVSKGARFREAHTLVGRVVRYALEQGKELSQLELAAYRNFSDLFEADLFDRISLESALQSKSAEGGTAPTRVREALSEARQYLSKTRP